ncbi:DUF3592 domain-containing protein [Streptomyces sp. NPDC005722]
MAVVSIPVLWLSWRIRQGSNALRKRGVRTRATCVNIGGGPNGSVMLMVQFTTDSGEGVRTTIGPFNFPPARVGGVVEVVYDPREPGNVLTPDNVGSGRVALCFVVGSAATLLLSLALLVLG